MYRILSLFDCPLKDVKRLLPIIKEQGFNVVQVSPLQRNKTDNTDEWWLLYQPLGFDIGNKIGTKEELYDLCQEARRYGIHIIVDTVINHVANKNDKEWKWEWLDCYYFEDCHMYPKEIIYIQEDDSKYFFEYNSENKNFNKISTEELSTLLSNGLRIPDRCSSKEYLWLSEIRDGKSK